MCIILVMTLFNWHEKMAEDALHESDHSEDNSACRTITTTGDVQSSLHGSSVYSVRRNGGFQNVLQLLRAICQSAQFAKCAERFS